MDFLDFVKNDSDVSVAGKYVANRLRYIGCTEYSRCDLIKQRLKYVVVLPVDDGYLDIGGLERLRTLQTAESCAEYDDLLFLDIYALTKVIGILL